MEPFEIILSAGGHSNSLGRANEVLDIVKKDSSRTDELFSCINSEDAWVRMRAIDTFEKLVKENPKLAKPYSNTLTAELTKSDQPSIQWHLAQLFAEIELSEAEQARSIKWLKEKVSDIEVDWIVSVNTMKALLHFWGKGLVEGKELMSLFEIQTRHKSKTVRKKATEFLEHLK